MSQLSPNFSGIFTHKLVKHTEDEMPRISLDGMMLQAHLSADETMTIERIALEVFGEPGQKEPTAVQRMRAKRAASNLVNLQAAKAIPNVREMTAVQSVVSAGTQAAAAMNMMIRRGVEVVDVGTLEVKITPAGRVIPPSPIVEEVLQEKKARVSSPFDIPHYAIM